MESVNIDLQGVGVHVVNVHFDGLGRTKDDFVAPSVKDIYLAKTFGELIVRVGQAQEKLRRLETFRDVRAIIDVSNASKGADPATDNGYDITFSVQEMGRVAASAKTQMGAQADAQVKTGLRMPNVFGRGERLEVEYSYSSSEERNMEFSFVKPYPFFLDSSIKSTLFYGKAPNVQSLYRNTALGLLTTYSCSKFLKWGSLHHKTEWEATWRTIAPSTSSTPFSIRLECGDTFKSALRHVLTIDNRDRQVFPRHGIFANVIQEIAGIGGDVKFHKVDVDLQHNTPLPFNMVFQTSFRAGILTPLGDERSCGIGDKFFMGGPYSLRGFTLRGINTGPDGLSLGGKVHWSSGVHLYTRLPSVNHRFPLVDNCRLHFFINAGSLVDKFFAGKILDDMRASVGAGLAVALGDFARLEVNYCWPIKTVSGDKTVNGFQLGAGVHFL